MGGYLDEYGHLDGELRYIVFCNHGNRQSVSELYIVYLELWMHVVIQASCFSMYLGKFFLETNEIFLWFSVVFIMVDSQNIVIQNVYSFFFIQLTKVKWNVLQFLNYSEIVRQYQLASVSKWPVLLVSPL